MRIFDPIHGLIPFVGEDAPLKRVIDTPAFQRLRRVRQLGFSDLVYPGATHSRFAHSVGVFHNARRLLRLMESQMGPAFEKRKARVAKLAALLHDVGHGPFSHAFEGALKRLGREFSIEVPKHEHWSARIIREDRREDGLKRAVAQVGKEWRIGNLGNKVAAMLAKEQDVSPEDKLYADIVSSQFDADRLDYLVRDRRSTGVDIGNFEADWLLDCLRVQEHRGRRRLVVANKGRLSVEAYLLARVQLHEMIYFHPTTRGFEKIFGQFVVRLGRSLKKEGVSRRTPRGCQNNPLTYFLRKFVNEEKLRVKDYLALDDTVVWTLLSQVRRDGDSTLRNIAGWLMGRAPISCLEIDPGPSSVSPKRRRLIKDKGQEVAQKLIIAPWQCDFLSLSAYKRSEETGDDEPEIYLRQAMEGAGGGGDPECVPIAEASSLVKSLDERSLFRIYFKGEKEEARVRRLLEDNGISDAGGLHDLVFTAP